MATKKVTAKTSTKKPAAKKAVKSSKNENRSIVGIPGNEDKFYQGFPRFAAYKLLLTAPKRTMKVSTFLAKVEKLKSVGTPARANGILQKLVDKKRHVGVACAKFA